MVPSALSCWQPAFVVLTVCVLVVGNSAAAREHGDTNFAENLFIGFSNACRSIMKTHGSEPGLYAQTRKLKVVWYGPSGPKTFPIEEAIEQINQTSLPTNRDRIVITIHGFNDHAESTVPLAIAEAYRTKQNYNVMLLDSSELTTGQYMRAAFMSQLIGKKLALLLVELMKLGMTADGIQLIGISLGAQTAGWAGRFFQNMTGTKINRITGLDPAGPCFTYAENGQSLNENDAEFVDVIHVNRGIQGILEDVGHVDFFVNGGGPNQPGCDGPNCSHQRAGLIYIESFAETKPFVGRKCGSWKDFKNNLCSDNVVNNIGLDVTKGLTGKFYLRTAGTQPFSLGEKGSYPEPKKMGFFSKLFG